MLAMNDVEPIGQRIKRERHARAMTQRDLAQRVGVGTPHISKVEAGRENPSDDLLQRFAEVFDCEFEELLVVARRIPEDVLDVLATDPRGSLHFLRSWKRGDT